jgi:outer membrane protein assembly factor BamD
MKKYILGLFAVAVISSCVSQQERAMRSADKEFILKAANENFAKKKWKNALALYDRLANLVAGTDDFPNVGFNTAYANYYDKSYKLAGHQFKNFAVSFQKIQEQKRHICLHFVTMKDLWITTWISPVQNWRSMSFRIS